MRQRVTRGLAWTGASQVMLQVIRTGAAIFVARLLTPSEYGLAMLALVFASLVLVFSDLALGAALVQRKTLSERDRSTAFWITIGAGITFTVLGIALAGPVAGLYGQPSAEPLLAVLSLSFILTALGATQQSLLLREMDFRRLELLTVGGALAGAAAAVALAAAGTGPWAIIGQQLATAVITSALMWRASSWRPRLIFSGASLRDLGGFSAYLMGHRLLFYVHQNADRFIIGRFIGTAALGAYAVAYNVMLAPAARIGGPLQRVLAPAFSRMQDEPARIAAAWARVTRILATIVLPSLAGLVVVAPDFVPVVLGEPVGGRRARHPDPRVGRCHSGAPEHQRRHPRGARPHVDDLPLLDRLHDRAHHRVRHRPALGHHRHRGRLRRSPARSWSRS